MTVLSPTGCIFIPFFPMFHALGSDTCRLELTDANS